MKRHPGILLAISLFLIGAQIVHAQNEVRKFGLLSGSDSIQVSAAVSFSNADLKNLQLANANFPIASVPLSIFSKVIEKSNQTALLNSSYEYENRLLAQRDTLNIREIQKLRDVISSQGRNIELYQNVNDKLNRSVSSLTDQLNNTQLIMYDMQKRRLRTSQIKVLTLGSMGLALGIIIGGLVAK